MKALFPLVIQIACIRRYFPEYEKGRLPDRAYFFKIVGTLMSSWLTEQIEAARKKRNEHVDQNAVLKRIEMTDKALKELEESGASSSK